MSQESFLGNLLEIVSGERIEPYFKVRPQSDAEAIAVYSWNIALCESLYPALNCFEIALRNSIHSAGTVQFGTEFWFSGHLRQDEAERLNSLRLRLIHGGNRNPSVGDLVSGLSLGFWSSLFKGQYERILWPLLLPSVFPHAPRRQRSRTDISRRVDRIRRLRNRVFHHEPIWHLPDLADQHALILETIGWISPAMLAMTRLLDRFDSVYTRGSKPFTVELETIAQSWNA